MKLAALTNGRPGRDRIDMGQAEVKFPTAPARTRSPGRRSYAGADRRAGWSRTWRV